MAVSALSFIFPMWYISTVCLWQCPHLVLFSLRHIQAQFVCGCVRHTDVDSVAVLPPGMDRLSPTAQRLGHGEPGQTG